MTRLLNAANIAAAKSGHVRPVNFVQLGFDSGTIYIHDSIGTFTWGGEDWLGVGTMGAINTVREGETVNPYKLEMNLSGLDSALATEALTLNPYGRELILYIGFLDADEQLVADPDEMWSGTIQQMNLSAGQNNNCVIIAESDLIKLKKNNGLLFTDKAQQDRFTGDVIFEYQPQIKDAKPVWLGRVNTGSNFSEGGPGFSIPGINIGF